MSMSWDGLSRRNAPLRLLGISSPDKPPNNALTTSWKNRASRSFSTSVQRLRWSGSRGGQPLVGSGVKPQRYASVQAQHAPDDLVDAFGAGEDALGVCL